MKVLVTDDHPLVRSGLVSILSVEDEIESVIEASSVKEAMDRLKECSVDIAMIDLKLGREDGLEVVRRARKIELKTKLVILTSSMRKEDFQRAKECGIDGYILKKAFAEDILYAMHTVCRNRKYYDPEILERFEERESCAFDALTPREKDVALALAEGLDNAGISSKLFISLNTVKKHISNIMSKLEMTHRTQVAIYTNREIGRNDYKQ